MNRRFKLFALIAAIVFTLVFMGTTVTAYDVVQPDGSYCLDQVGVISDSTKTYIAERNKNLEENCKGAQMCVVVLDSIGWADIEEYSADVFSTWQIGRSGEDNGVLFLMLIGDQNYWIMPGTGLEDVLSTAALSTVINVYCEPNFAQGDYDTAVLKTFTRLNELICQDYGVNPEGTVSGSGSFVGGNGGSGSGNNGGSGTGTGNSLYGRSCSDIHLPHYYSCGSCGSCDSCMSCSSCLLSCSYCGGCGSCTGVWGILFFLFIIYVILQVLRGMGRGVHRVNRSPGGVYYGPRAGGPGPRVGGPGPGSGPRPGGYSAGPRPRGGSTSHSTGSGRPSFGGFSGGGGSSRGGGAGRPSGSFGSGSRSTGGSGRSGGFGGFSGGGGSSRGGGAGRK